MREDIPAPSPARKTDRRILTVALPALIGLALGVGLRLAIGWWGFLVLFPWVGTGISIGILVRTRLPPARRDLGRRVAIAIVAPSLLFFVPIANRENLQLEGVVFLLSVGSFSKGVVHYAVAKVFGPLIWGRGFCGWACWTIAPLEWLPQRGESRAIPPRARHLRYAALALSVGLPLLLIAALGFDPQSRYFGRHEVAWMLAGNGVYYLAALALATLYRDRRAFCKIACPVSLVMKLPSRRARLRRRPTGEACVECGECNRACPMDVDVMSSIARGQTVRDTECILCYGCVSACPVRAVC